MLWSAAPQGETSYHVGCLSGSFNYTLRMHTVGSMEPNKRKCQSLTHLGARSCISVSLINGAEAGWEHDTVMDSPPQLIKLGEFDAV